MFPRLSTIQKYLIITKFRLFPEKYFLLLDITRFQYKRKAHIILSLFDIKLEMKIILTKKLIFLLSILCVLNVNTIHSKPIPSDSTLAHVRHEVNAKRIEFYEMFKHLMTFMKLRPIDEEVDRLNSMWAQSIDQRLRGQENNLAEYQKRVRLDLMLKGSINRVRAQIGTRKTTTKRVWVGKIRF